MFENKKFLALIPARGGSKRLPKKNILPLEDKPLIAWSIEAAKKSSYIDKIVVSSDDVDILHIAKEYGATTLQRAAELATDTANSVDVALDILRKFKEYDYLILLQPTSPLRTTEDIDNAIEMLMQKNADAIISVCEMEHSPLWSNTLPQDKSLTNFLPPEASAKRSQDLPTYYRLNGAIYLIDTHKLATTKSFFLEKNIYAYIMPQERSIDIDTQLDFQIAQVLLRNAPYNNCK